MSGDMHRDGPPEAAPFQQWLLAQRGGLCHAELTDRLAEVVAGVIEHGKQGRLQLTIAVKRSDVGGVAVMVTDTITAKVPAGERPAALFFAADGGGLVRQDPRQPELPLRGLDTTPTPVRDIRRAES